MSGMWHLNICVCMQQWWRSEGTRTGATLWAAMWMLGTKCRSSTRALSTLNQLLSWNQPWNEISSTYYLVYPVLCGQYRNSGFGARTQWAGTSEAVEQNVWGLLQGSPSVDQASLSLGGEACGFTMQYEQTGEKEGKGSHKWTSYSFPGHILDIWHSWTY